MSWYETMNNINEKCRFCGLDLPSDPALVITHFNNHWRQCNNEPITLSSCAFESNLGNNVRVDSTSNHHEDLEVSVHMEPTFPYSYSPQTEPSNLTVSGPRCSPLNLTGRAKSSSPLPAHMTLPTQANNIMNQNVVEPLQTQPVYHVDVVEGNSSHLLHPIPLTNHTLDAVNTSCQVSSGLQSKKEKHNDLRCEVCNKLCTTKSNLDEHLHTHPKVDPLNNQYLMSAEHIDMNQTVDNVINSFSDKSYQCSVCDQEFTYREELLEHIESYEAAKPYKCEICRAGMSSLSALRRHKLTHTGNKPHRCQICGRSFFQKFDLQRHQSVHKKTKEFDCSTCFKKFTSLHCLKKHKCVDTPNDTNLFKCNICGRTCANNLAWSYHMWKHTKNAVFVPVQNDKQS